MDEKHTFRSRVKVDIDEKQLVSDIVSYVKRRFDNALIEEYKYSTQLVLIVCNYIEKITKTLTRKYRECRDRKIDKKYIVLRAFTELFNDVDLDVIDSMVEMVHRKNLIRKPWSLVSILERLITAIINRLIIFGIV